MSPTIPPSARINPVAKTAEYSSQQPQHQQHHQHQQSHSNFTKIIDQPPLPIPRKARNCPLFCCFYAEFDNVVGPRICYESPTNFMEQDTDVSLQDIHKLLAANFERILKEHNGIIKQKKSSSSKETTSSVDHGDSKIETGDAGSPQSPASSSTQPPAIRGAKSSDTALTTLVANTSSSAAATTAAGLSRKSQQTAGDGTSQNSAPNNVTKEAFSKEGGGGTATPSIFESTSDFIITGSELTGNIVNLSAFNMHLLTRPTIIHDERYERNSLLFCVGFVLRRTEDPRPFRPLLSKLAMTLKRMEIESHFLSKQNTRQQIQPLLDRMLVSLNCTQLETNLVISNTVLNLKLFHPPKYPASPVKDHSVPILLRRDWQVQMYDWDLAINWVVLHIDGVANARQISKKAEVDMEMVRNCLRVLKHHGVIAVIDMFFYSNRYESTKRAAGLLAGQEPSLLQDAAEYVVKRPPQGAVTNIPSYSNLMAPAMSPPTHSTSMHERFVHPTVASPASPILPSSYPPEFADNTHHAAASILGSSLKYATFAASYQSQHDPQFFVSLRREEQRELKTALAELYCAFNRDVSFGDLWVALAAGRTRSYSVDSRSLGRDRSNSDSRDHSQRNTYQQQKQQGSNHINNQHILSHGDSIDISGSEGTGDQAEAFDMSATEYYFDRLRRKSTYASIDWRAVFDMFDHRRFVSFGLVNGLLHRMHNYPFVLDTASSQSKQNKESFFLHDSRSPSIEEANRMARSIAMMMDGLHCDDHIASVFEKPVNELIDFVQRVKGKKVLSTYSVAEGR
jgi:Nitrogen permease regulator 2